MLAENPQILDIDVNQLKNFCSIFSAPKSPPPAIFLMYAKDTIIKAVHTEQGLLKLKDVKWEGKETLIKLYKRYNVHSLWAVEKRALRSIASEFQSRISYEQDFIQQGFTLWKIILEHLDKDFYHYPPYLNKFRFLNYKLVRGIFNLLFGRNSSILFLVFEKSSLPVHDECKTGVFTSWIIGIRRGEISLITTSEFLEDELKISNWQTDYQMVVDLISKYWEKPVLGIFMDKETFKELKQASKGLGYLKRAIKEKRILFSPYPLRFKLLILFLNLIGKRWVRF